MNRLERPDIENKPTERLTRCGYVDRITVSDIRGWVLDSSSAQKRLKVIITFDRNPVATIRADRLRPDLIEAGRGDGRYGFEYRMNPWDLFGVRKIQVLDEKTGWPLPIGKYTYRRRYFRATIHDHKINGWGINLIRPHIRETVRLLINGKDAAKTRCALFREDLYGLIYDGFYGFEFSLKPFEANDRIEVVDRYHHRIVSGRVPGRTEEAGKRS